MQRLGSMSARSTPAARGCSVPTNSRKLKSQTVNLRRCNVGVCTVRGLDAGKEGFSLIDAHKWCKAVRRADCVLFGSKVKNESRMFRVQFSGDSHRQALEGCSTCVQMLLQYIDVQNPDGKVQNQALQLSQPTNVSLSGSLELESQERGLEEGQTEAQNTLLEGRVSIKQLAKSMLGATSPKLPLAYQQSTLNAEELGPFLRLCLLDQGFPEFVEQVEQELKKLIDA
ncbi:meiotic recombination protein REC114-like isoform X2 [Scyliorhinus torazame]|uniref:meiotic recombination protein REC114-like isoform X2 n=1 Tax=Scyliorhinus torazame TaxID=75743 RepID=UPI003B58CECB